MPIVMNENRQAMYAFVHGDDGVPYVYGDQMESYREEPGYKLNATDIAGGNGKRLGKSFQDMRRIVAKGSMEAIDDGIDKIPLDVVVQGFRRAHRAGTKGRLYTNSADSGYPAEYLVAQVENLNGLEWVSPQTTTEWECSFTCEPEYWFDTSYSVDLLQNGTGSTYSKTYQVAFMYHSLPSGLVADAPGAPFITLSVSGLDVDRDPNLLDNNVVIASVTTGQTFIVFPVAAVSLEIDSYAQTCRNALTKAPFEALEHNGFLNVVDGVNTFTVTCNGVSLSSAPMLWKPRHW